MMKQVLYFYLNFILMAYALNMKAQVYTYSQFSKFQKKAKTEGLEKIQYAVAQRFHVLLNQYREQKKLKALVWNDVCFLAAHNHNAWMAESNKLSHEQNQRNAFYTGLNPGDRVAWLLKGSSMQVAWSAENCLLSYVDDMDAIQIEQVAKDALEQWKNSAGHNANMLGKNHGSCGTAFLFSNGEVWGTTLFAFPGQ